MPSPAASPEDTAHELARLQLRDLRERRRTAYEKRWLWFIVLLAFAAVLKSCGAI